MTIIAAVDRSDSSDAVVEQGRQLAERFDEELHVVHVLSREEFFELDRTTVERQQAYVSDTEIQETAAEIASELASAGGPDVVAVGRVGNAAREIVAYSEEEDARFVVIGSRKRSPVGKAVFGSTTQSVLLNADRPVVAVRNA